VTVVVAFLCYDGVVVAVDSMLTTSSGNIPVAHHTGRKVEVLAGGQVFAFAGDLGQGARFRTMADGSHQLIANATHPLDYAIALTSNLIKQFNATGIANSINVNTILAFEHRNNTCCCVFEGAIQPRFLDKNHFFVSLGSGKLAADPFLRFLVDTFCEGNQPSVREALFLATWTVEHVIHTNPGGVAGPIRVAILKNDRTGVCTAMEVVDAEIDEHREAIESATQALRYWRDRLRTGGAAISIPRPFELQHSGGKAIVDMISEIQGPFIADVSSPLVADSAQSAPREEDLPHA
jgi:20S proteasome alpha/beta subunit